MILWFIVVNLLLVGNFVRVLCGQNETRDFLEQELFEEGNESSTRLKTLIRRKRLLGGEKVRPDEARYVGSLQRKIDRKHICGGMLISYRHMVTACSCVLYGVETEAGFPHEKPSAYIVVAGDRYWSNKLPERTREVAKFHKHHSCSVDEDTGMWKFGVGYVEFVQPFAVYENLAIISNLPDKQVKYEEIFKKHFEMTKLAQGGNEYCYAFGWGANRYIPDKGEPYVFPEFLIKRAVQFISLDKCQERLCNNGMCSYKIDESGAVCASSPDNNIGPLCKGDPGTPLLCLGNWMAVGEETPDCGATLRFSLFFKLEIEKIVEFQNAAISPFVHSSYATCLLIVATAFRNLRY